MKKATIVWEIQKAVFDFDSQEDLNTWVSDGSKLGFSFYLGNADDSETIFSEVEDEEIVNIVLNNDQYVSILEDDTVVVNASVSFSVDIEDSVTIEDFEQWVDTCSGWSCGDLYLLNGGELSSWEDGDISLIL